MAVEIRRFSESGIQSFSEQIRLIKSGNASGIPDWLLEDDEYSEKLPTKVTIENKIFSDKLDMAIYINKVLERSAITNPFSDNGLWSWLAAFYFEQLCKKDKKNTIIPGAENRYILYEGWNRRYRHTIAIPVMMYKFHGESASYILNSPINNYSDFEEQLFARLDIFRNTNLITVAKILYWDEKRQKPKIGVTSKEKRGGLRRFVSVINQLNLTYDLMAMKPEEIIEILPSEFSQFM